MTIASSNPFADLVPTPTTSSSGVIYQPSTGGSSVSQAVTTGPATGTVGAVDNIAAQHGGTFIPLKSRGTHPTLASYKKPGGGFDMDAYHAAVAQWEWGAGATWATHPVGSTTTPGTTTGTGTTTPGTTTPPPGGTTTPPATTGAQSSTGNYVANTPGYKWTMQQGLDAINSNAYARGLGNSSATFKALQDWAQNYANGQYQQNINNLMAVSGIGQNAAGALTGVSQQYGNGATTAMQNAANAASNSAAANANAAGTLGQGIAGGLGSIAGGITKYGSSYAAPAATASPINVSSGTQTYFNNNPFGY